MLYGQGRGYTLQFFPPPLQHLHPVAVAKELVGVCIFVIRQYNICTYVYVSMYVCMCVFVCVCICMCMCMCVTEI